MEQMYLYIILSTALLAIAGLAVALYRCRRRLHQCQRAMVRCINENIEMKEKLPEYELPNFLNREDITPEEFTRIIHNMLKRLMFLSVLFLLMTAPMVAQEKADTTFVFRFIPGNDMFFVPFHDNETELVRLEECVIRYRQEILNGNIPLRVDGHCTTANNADLARVRSNRVKSELIVRQKLTEDCFITCNHSGSGDYVTVRISVPLADKPGKGISDLPQEETAMHEPQETKGITTQEPPTQSVQAEQPQANETAQAVPVAKEGMADTYRFSLRANLLRWATLTPDLGLEWRISRRWGIAVNGSWTSWSWNDKDRRYALWEVSPEVRCYVGKKKRGYLGAMYKAGEFHYKLSATGKQGDLMGGGLAGGYQLRLTDALSLDFTLAVGCLHADYEKYGVTDGVRVRQGKESKNWWGPINAGVTLVWMIK